MIFVIQNRNSYYIAQRIADELHENINRFK